MLHQLYSVLSAFVGVAGILLILMAVVFGVFAPRRLRRWRPPALFITPGLTVIILLLGYPLVFSLYLAGTNMSMTRIMDHSWDISFYVENIRWLFDTGSPRSTLPILFGRTAVWASIQIVLRVALGMMLALALAQPIRMRAVFKFLLLLPWAMPGIILILSLQGEFHYDYGFVNNMLRALNLPVYNWFSNAGMNMLAMHLVGLYLSIPYFMLIVEGALRSLPASYLEAAEIDGAGPIRRLFSITIPLIAPVLWPPILFSILYLFSEFDIPYIMNAQRLEGSNLMATWILELAFRFSQYARSAAAGWIFMTVMLLVASFLVRIGNVLPKEIRE